MAKIDAPLLENLSMTFFNDFIFRVPQLYRFISQVEAFGTLRHAKVFSDYSSIACTLSPRADPVECSTQLSLKICCPRVNWQLSSLAQVCSSSLSPLSIVEELEIESQDLWSSLPLPDNMEPDSTHWLELLGPFTAVKNLILFHGVPSRVCPALKEIVGEMVTEVLPALQNLFLYQGDPLKGPRKSIEIFVAARRWSGRPVSVHSRPGSGKWRDITEDLACED